MASDINGFIIFGLGLVIVGIIWMVFDAELVDIKVDYWISTPYLEVMNMGFNVAPIVVFFLGIIMCLAGFKSRGTS